MFKKLLLIFIRIYQKTLSTDHGLLGKILGERWCRFYPSCSEYSYQAIDRFGIMRGISLSLKRVIRCHPWNKGGINPIPDK